MPPRIGAQGWHPTDKWDSFTRRTVRDYIASLTYPTFELSSAYAAIKDIGDEVNVFFWKAEEVVLGGVLPSYHQTIGSCVSQGFGRAAQDQVLIDISDRRDQEHVPDDVNRSKLVATEPIYGGSRNEIGGGRLGNSDGSVGSWAARWVQEYGILFRKKYGKYDFSQPDESLAKRWGNRGAGVPDELEPQAKDHPIVEVSVVQRWEAARDALVAGNSVTICSSRGFTTTRQAGFCKPSGSWNHCMVLRGAGVAKGNRPFGIIQNSWGDNNPSGPNKLTLETGEVIDLPGGCFAADAEVIDRDILRSGDCHVLSGIRGFRRTKFRPSDILI